MRRRPSGSMLRVARHIEGRGNSLVMVAGDATPHPSTRTLMLSIVRSCLEPTQGFGERRDSTQDITTLCCMAGSCRYVAARGCADRFACAPGLGFRRCRGLVRQPRPWRRSCRRGWYAHAWHAGYAQRSGAAHGSVWLLRHAGAYAAAFRRSRRPSSCCSSTGRYAGHARHGAVACAAIAQCKSARATVRPAGITV